jgi:hypothetical protein
MSNLNAIVVAEIDKNATLLKKKGDILEIGRIVQSRGGNNAATRTVRSLIAKLRSKHTRNLNTVLAEAKLAAKLTRGGTRGKGRKGRKGKRGTRRH